METSNLIALGALIVAVLGLIPQFYAMYSTKGKQENSDSVPSPAAVVSNSKKADNVKEPMPYMLRILMQVIFAVASFLIEIIIFGIVAYLFGVSMDLNTMPLVWKLIFYSLFLIPGAFLFLAFLTFIANTTD